MFCKKCGQQIKEGSRFCKHCGANLMQTAGQPMPFPNAPLTPTNGNGTARKVGNKKVKGYMIGAGIIGIILTAIIVGLFFFNSEAKFSSLSEQKQDKLTTKFHEYLDQRFVSDLQIDKQVAQDVSMSYLWDAISGEDLENIIRKDIENKTAIEMRKLGERWATDNNLDLEDLTNNNVIEVLFEDYVSNLTQKVADDAITLMQEMKATFREEGLRQLETESNIEDFVWIVGDWMNSETGREFTFEADGTFSTGDDCTSTGIFTIQGNTVHLNGKTVCPDCEDCEESDYNETMTISGETLERYKKLSTYATTTAPTSNNENNSSQSQTNSGNYIVRQTVSGGVEAYLFYRPDEDGVCASILWDDRQGNLLTIYTDRNLVVSLRHNPSSSGNNRDYSPNYLGPTTTSSGVHTMMYSFGSSAGRFFLNAGGYVILGYADKTTERFNFRR